MKEKEMRRHQAKTPDQQFVRVLEQEFHYAPRVAQAICEEAEACWEGRPGGLRPGQTRVMLVKSAAGHGQALKDTPMAEVIWTVDAGKEDQTILQKHGRKALRRVQIQRLTSEAVEQGAVASQEDLARALHVSVRTIKRDCAKLRAQGVYLPTRGNLHGIGRGQTHKARIVGLWLEGRTYDQIAMETHHSISSVKRYVQDFVQIIRLYLERFEIEHIALLASKSPALIKEYLAIYKEHNSPACRERLENQLQRLEGASKRAQEPKKGAL